MKINTSLHTGEVKASCAGRLAGRHLALKRQWKLFSCVQFLLSLFISLPIWRIATKERTVKQSTLNIFQLSWDLAPWKLGTETIRERCMQCWFFWRKSLWVWDVLSLSFLRGSTAPGRSCKKWTCVSVTLLSSKSADFGWQQKNGHFLLVCHSAGLGWSWTTLQVQLVLSPQEACFSFTHAYCAGNSSRENQIFYILCVLKKSLPSSVSSSVLTPILYTLVQLVHQWIGWRGSKFNDDTKLGQGGDTTEECADIHQDLDRLESWAEKPNEVQQRVM